MQKSSLTVICLKVALVLGVTTVNLVAGPKLEIKPPEPFFEKYQPLKAPEATRLILKKGDRLAICGDSITEQKMYSRLIEDYITMCAPELNVKVRQYGWGGERTAGFLERMTNDCLRFKPTLATTSYGMNDHEYRSYQKRIGETYRSNSLAIIKAFKANGVRVIEGAPGCVGKIPWWQKGYTTEDLNLNLCELRNIGVELAREQNVGFADVFWPLFTGNQAAKAQYGTNYTLCGEDGIHPNWAGHTVMAYSYLKAMGLKGDIGTFVIDLKKNRMKASVGHEILSSKDGIFEIKSSRYPFCSAGPQGQAAEYYPVCGKDDPSKPDSIRSGMTVVPFNENLNRLMLVAKNGKAARYQVTWNNQSKTFTAEQLANGINLAAEFTSNPFSAAFAKVDAAVAVKQAYETESMKKLFRPREKATMEEIIAQTQKVIADTERNHESLAAAVQEAFVPVTHSIQIVGL